MTTRSHDPRRRLLLSAGGGLLLSAAIGQRVAAAGKVEITMSGTPSGSHVWFRPKGVHIQRGQAIRWINNQVGNVHTITAYHPDNKDKPLRIPEGANSWDSGYLMPNESFLMVFDVPGVYDYFCIPHEHAGMVGRIVVGDIDSSVVPYANTDNLLPENARGGFPEVSQILKSITVD